MTVAILLAQAGVAATLIERWPEVYPLPRAVHLDDEVMRILVRIGVGEEFRKVSRAAVGLRLLRPDHSTLAEFRRDEVVGRHGFPQANMYDQPELERVLRRQLESFPTVQRVFGTEVVRVGQSDTSAWVQCRTIDSGEEFEVEADYVLGADGANSLIRDHIGSRMVSLGFEQRWLVVDAHSEIDLNQWAGVHQVCSAIRAATFMQIGADRYRWEFRLLDGESAHDYATLDDLMPLLDPWVKDNSDALTLIRSVEYTFRAELADRWRQGRIFLLGDAAHLTPPFIGQGLGSGLRDAANLSWKLDRVLRSGARAVLLETYEAERRPHARQMIGLAKLVGVAMTSGGRTGEAIRELVAPRLGLVPSVRRRMTDSATPPLAASLAIRRSRFGSRRLVGTLAPNAVVVDSQRLDDVKGHRFVILTRCEPWLSQGLARVLDAEIIETPWGSVLDQWLREAKVMTALVRPDGTVGATARSRSDLSRTTAYFESLLGSPDDVGQETRPAATPSDARPGAGGPKPPARLRWSGSWAAPKKPNLRPMTKP